MFPSTFYIFLLLSIQLVYCRRTDISVEAIKVNTSFLLIDEDWPLNTPLPISICTNKFKFLKISSGNDQDTFSLQPFNDTCGYLKLEKFLDADQLHPDGSRSQSFTIHFENKYRMRSEVEIQVVDINDNPPKFIDFKKEIPLSENAPRGTLVTHIQTFDPDKGIGGIARFFINDNRFSIENEKCSNSRCFGDIILTSTLDYETSPKINLTITAKDGASRTINSKESHINIIINIIDEEDSPPYFITDLSIPILIPENTKLGNKVFQIRAEDGDKRSEKKNAIRYLIEENDIFSIDSETGWLILEKEVDFEQQRDYSLKIQAIESGQNAMVTDGTLLIQIEDIDDNIPRCLDESYIMYLNASSWKFNLDKPIQVFDADEGKYASFLPIIKGSNQIVFRIMPEIVQKSATLELEISNVDTSLLTSKINELKYKILLSPSNTSQRPGHCDLFVQLISSNIKNNNINNLSNNNEDENKLNNVTNGFNMIQKKNNKINISNEKDIKTSDIKENIDTIIVAGVKNEEIQNIDNKKVKVYFTQSSYPVILTCNTPVNTIVASVKPKDINNDKINEVKYLLVGEKSKDFSIDKSTGIITVKNILEKNQNISVDIVAYYTVDGNNGTSSVPLIVYVTDCTKVLHSHNTLTTDTNIIEEEKPSLYFGEINENSMIGKEIIKLPIIMQKDKVNITYKVFLEETKEPLVNLSEDGEIIVGQVIDYEKYKSLNGHVVEFEGDEKSIILANFTIYIRDQNDNPPVFKKQIYEIELSEDSEVGKILQFDYPLATDEDSGIFSKLKYSFVRGPISLPFFIDEITSEIKLNSSLDYESVKKYEIEIKVIDNGDDDFNNEAISKLIVHVKNVNDNAPIFLPLKSNTFEISEDDTIGTIITILKANDLDENDIINYSLQTSNSEDEKYFNIDNEGKIVLGDSVKGMVGKNYTIEVKASDSGNPPLTATIKIYVIIKKASNGPIILWPKQNSVHFFKENEEYQSLLQINATLSDEYLVHNPNSKINFSIVQLSNDDWKNFEINNDGILRSKNVFDYEIKTKYELQIEVCDNESRCVLSNFRIMVTDINDNCPYFETLQNVEKYEITENIPIKNDEIGEKIAEIIPAIDKDGTLEFQSICYKVHHPNDKFFFPNKKIPTLYTNTSLDREYKDSYNVIIKTFDCNEYNTKLTCKDNNLNINDTQKIVIVKILDLNDNYPKFRERVFYGEIIQGKTKFGDVILNLEAIDLDIEPNGLSYSVLETIQIGTQTTKSERLPFSINSKTGEVVNNLFMNIDTPKNFTFNVIVQDSAGHEDEAKVIITVVEHYEQVEIIFDADISFIQENQKEIEKKLYEATSLKFIIDGIHDMGNDTKVSGHFLNQYNTVVSTASVTSILKNPVNDWQGEAQDVLYKQYKMKPIYSPLSENFEFSERYFNLFVVIACVFVFLVLLLLFCICRQVCCKKKNKLSELEKFRRHSLYHTNSLQTNSLKMPPPPPFTITNPNVVRAPSQNRVGEIITAIDMPYVVGKNTDNLTSTEL
ncbi:Cadherin domain and Cadherin-like domain-containing protein [Strongyloides ratti]|uniref:Cadherin domain and Cadherin-like domain-containing protein n=1 Tax=Strongyloides ratti TaxID=34506 RepID=A0A090KTF2_STRRB|nr:Cadherin domain and Cadherin-like domain-containing protein [Strongyloides ratti]CEF60775.1 Cadherin domain and Cadherin-like domain-containing protein [Strongyloides ratti]